MKKNNLNWNKLVDEVPKEEAKRVIKIGEVNENEKTYYRIKHEAGTKFSALEELEQNLKT